MNAEVKTLLEKRSKILDRMLQSVLLGSGAMLVDANIAHAHELMDLDDRLHSLKEQGFDIKAHITTLTYTPTVAPQTRKEITSYVDAVTIALRKRGVSTSRTPKDTSRSMSILTSSNPLGKASAMSKNTMDLGKLYRRGIVFLAEDRFDLAEPFLVKVGNALMIQPPTSVLWDRYPVNTTSTPVPPEKLDGFDLSTQEKAAMFDSLLLRSRGLVDRALKEGNHNVQEEAFHVLVGLLGLPALRAVKLTGNNT